MDKVPLTNTAESRSADPMVPGVLLEATRALIRIRTAIEARNVATDLVTAFGGTLTSARSEDTTAVPVDVSFGAGEPILPCAPPTSVARMLIERYLPSFVVDARRALEVNLQVGRDAEDASIDSLTGLANRRMVGRALGRLKPGEYVIMVDLDNFKETNDAFGHEAGDRVLRALGRTIRATVRGRDFVGRYGGDEFVVILGEAGDPVAFLKRLRDNWQTERPYMITFSAGIASVGEETSTALQAADHAMYKAKQAGRDRWTSTPQSEPLPQSSINVTGHGHGKGVFVAFSELHVPEDGKEQLEIAFRDRLGAVERWPGFQSLEVWSDLANASSYAMVSWWTSSEAFRQYMRSDDHRESHARIPFGELGPRPNRFRRYEILSR